MNKTILATALITASFGASAANGLVKDSVQDVIDFRQDVIDVDKPAWEQHNPSTEAGDIWVELNKPLSDAKLEAGDNYDKGVVVGTVKNIREIKKTDVPTKVAIKAGLVQTHNDLNPDGGTVVKDFVVNSAKIGFADTTVDSNGEVSGVHMEDGNVVIDDYDDRIETAHQNHQHNQQQTQIDENTATNESQQNQIDHNETMAQQGMQTGNDALVNSIENGQAIDTNSQYINDNTAAISNNASRIATNEENIKANSLAIDDLYNQVDDLRDDMYSGVAAAIAIGSLPDAPAGKSGFVGGYGNYAGSGNAFAVGYSFTTEDSNWKGKAGASFDSAGEVGISAGIGYFW